ncbi:MAG: hypothetical protein M3Z85_01340, partial [Acidobacteriota bacterium]|nr:hypothetical protein [Acidobacteriota bacterium]
AATSGGYQQTVESLEVLSPLLYGTPAMQDRARRRYGAIELSDGTSEHAMGVIGRLRVEEPGMRQKIAALSQASTSANPDDNTQIAVLNKVNNAGVLALQNSVATNDLIAAHAELMLRQQARERQAEAQHLNMEIEFRTNGATELDRQTNGSTAALNALRMP